MIKSLLAIAVLLGSVPAFACDCRSDAPRTFEDTFQDELSRGQWHDDPTDLVVVEAEVIDKVEKTLTEVLGSETRLRKASVMRLLIRSKRYDAFNAAPLSGGVVSVVAGDGASCNLGLAAFQPGARYRFILRPNVYVRGMFRIPACGVCWEAAK